MVVYRYILEATGALGHAVHGDQGHTFLVEIKTDARKRLTPLQQDFFENWGGGTLARIDSPDAALRMIGVLK